MTLNTTSRESEMGDEDHVPPNQHDDADFGLGGPGSGYAAGSAAAVESCILLPILSRSSNFLVTCQVLTFLPVP